MNEKIQATHLARKAVVYIRQSTLKQVQEHRESTARQYALSQRGADLGWQIEQVEVIDEDLGKSGASASWRTGFQHLAEDVARGRIGIIFAVEVSRLSRSSADWHRLLDLCGLADVLIADEQAVYTPRDYNDRLLLGLKGTMSEAEQYWMRLRLQGGKLSKARRGELFLFPPTGYEWDDAAKRFRFDPDEQVQRAIRLVFERFRLDGSAYAVMRYFAQHGLEMPVRDLATKDLRWVPPRHSLILGMLHSPIYTGTYVFGRHEERVALVDGQIRRRHVKRMAREDWKVCLHDHHPAYIGWEEYMANKERLHANRTNHQSPEQRGASRRGHALLQGVALCGLCGQRMRTSYSGKHGRAHYECRSGILRFGDNSICWSLAAAAVDDAVSKLFLEAVQPPEIELGLAVLHETEHQASEVDRQWKARLERARYEARLTERRYKAVDPDNRVVARTLEREWNDKLDEMAEIEREHEAVCRREKVTLTDQDRSRILALAKDLPRVWNAETTTNAERKNLLRMLVREVSLKPIDLPARVTQVRVLWQTDAVSEITVPRRSQFETCATPPDAVEIIRKLFTEKKSDPEIAAELNRLGMHTGQHRLWDATAVRWVRTQVLQLRRLPVLPRVGRQPNRRDDGLYSVRGVAAYFDVTDDIVRYWIEKGWLTGADGGGQGRPWWFELDSVTVKRLQTAKECGYGAAIHRNSKTRIKEEGHHA
jgi:DNA invertase Pin-like site-specific DNA recombinase